MDLRDPEQLGFAILLLMSNNDIIGTLLSRIRRADDKTILKTLKGVISVMAEANKAVFEEMLKKCKELQPDQELEPIWSASSEVYLNTSDPEIERFINYVQDRLVERDEDGMVILQDEELDELHIGSTESSPYQTVAADWDSDEEDLDSFLPPEIKSLDFSGKEPSAS